MHSVKEIGDQVITAVRSFVARELGPIIARLGALEAALKTPPAGPRGEKGERGEKGLDGQSGKDGINGKDGAAGRDGAAGKDGAPGEKGADGTAGAAGKDGAEGAQGPVGAAGKPGDAGAAGPQGERGERGEKGDPGQDGQRGEKGESGQLGARGEKGDAGKDGRDGRDGAPGARGEKGDAGRDSLEIVPLSAIDAQRSYPRGTWAKHRSGLWVARSATQGMDGWECVVAGVAALAASVVGRDMTVTIEASDGAKAELKTKLEHPMYRDIYRPEEKYEKGDVVSWGGSAWMAMTDAPTDKPGTSDQWRLIVKRGRDGKDGK